MTRRAACCEDDDDENEIVAPGDDIAPVHPPVDEEPPSDCFCDLVLTGGVASGVVYPWAIVELARHFRFRNIGGTSVGAMAAALAAAAEYGRRHGVQAPFEPLRRTPAALAEVLPDGRTRMLSLFQTNPHGRRLIALWGRLGRGETQGGKWSARWRMVGEVLRVYGWALPLGVLLLLAGIGIWAPQAWLAAIAWIWLLPAPVLILALRVLSDIRHGLIANGLGLCKGGSFEPADALGRRVPGISEWLHRGIQRSAGLKASDRPLTFRDLWSAPAYPGAVQRPCGDGDDVRRRSINLVMITTNVTHGRPYRLPLTDTTSRLYFRPAELQHYFPQSVLDALVTAARPYVPLSGSDPKHPDAAHEYLELPRGDLPVVVAARLSLSFPLLFSAVPLWAIDYEEPDPAKRQFRRCQFTDGGVSSNFPVHLFDSALPRWPTFGVWLDRRSPHQPRQKVWLPDHPGEGRGDSWHRFDPQAVGPGQRDLEKLPESCLKYLFGFLRAGVTSAIDWRDRTAFRMPHVRGRVARLMLEPGHGGLHIGMPREQILRMADQYGTAAGREFVRQYKPAADGRPSAAWTEQRWVRLRLLIDGLRERMTGLASAADWAAYTQPMHEAIRRSTGKPGPVRSRSKKHRMNGKQAASLGSLLAELERMEQVLSRAELPMGEFEPQPEMRLRAPL